MNNHLTQIKHRRNAIGIILAVLILAVVGTSVWFLQKRTQQNPKAAASTILAFNTPAQTVNSGQSFSSDITVDPGTNQVSVVKVVLTYDNSQLSVAQDASSLTSNKTAFPQTLETIINSCTGTQCTLSATFSVGADPTKAIQTKTTLATFTATAIAANQTAIRVGFDPASAVYSIASTDKASENVLSSTVPLSLTVGSGNTSGTPTPTQGAICAMNTATCAWDTLDGATSYHYKITDTTTNSVVKEGDITPPQASVDFPQQPGDTYICSVTAANVCKTGSATAITNTCPIKPSGTPTPTPTPTPTSILTPQPTPTAPITATPGPSATPGPTTTPTPQLATCNQSCTTDTTCGNGLACVGGFCRNPSCSSNSNCSCTQPTQPVPTQPIPQITPTTPQFIAAAPTATPTPIPPRMMPTGPGDIWVQIGIVGIALVVVGGLLIFGL